MRQRGRPLPGPAQVEDLLARLDHGAVDDPGHGRRHLVGFHGDHHLVQQRQAGGGLAQREHRPAKAEPAQRNQVRVAEALADLGRLVEGGGGGGGVALDQELQPGREQQVALLDAVPLEVVEQPAAPGDPAAAAGDLAAVEEAEGQPERAADRSLHVPPAQERLMRSRPHVDAVVVPPDQERGRGQPLQVLRLQRGLPVGRRQLRERIRPRPTPERLPAPIERVGHHHPPSPLHLWHLTGPPGQVEAGQARRGRTVRPWGPGGKPLATCVSAGSQASRSARRYVAGPQGRDERTVVGQPAAG